VYLTITIQDDHGQPVGTMMMQAKTFKTGSEGFFGQAKVEIDGARYQIQAQAVRIGSKEGAKAGAPEAQDETVEQAPA
jgi:hypothetical protein